MEAIDPAEIAKRVRAAMAYGSKERGDVAAALNLSPRTVDRITGSGSSPPRGAEWKDLVKIADLCGLPAEWFSADLSRLAEVVTDGPIFRRPETTAREARSQRARRALEQTAEEQKIRDAKQQPRPRRKRSQGTGS